MIEVRGEVALWREVLVRALEDAQGKGQCLDPRERWLAESQALLFLTAKVGGWASARRRICDLAQLDPEALERLVHEKLMTKQLRAA